MSKIFSLACLTLSASLWAAPGYEITVYNGSQALVKDRRSLDIPRGRSSLPWEGVAQTLDASSASFTSPNARLLEQNYRYDLVSRAVLLQKYLGREVTLVEDADGKLPVRERKGKILSLEGDRITSFESDGKILLDPPGRVVLPSLPEGLLVQPTLVLDLQSRNGGNSESELRYLCTGLSWEANYVAVLDSAASAIDLDGLVTLTNHSGTTFKDAHLKIVAGDVNCIPANRPQTRFKSTNRLMALGAVAMDKAEESDAPSFQEEALMEYHLYDLQRPTTLRDNEQKQIDLLSARGAAVQKHFVFDESYDSRYWWWNREDTKSGRKLAIIVDVPNTENGHLGLPLPKGKVRVYQADHSGALQFVGEDQIDHTPKDDTLHLALGQAFDLSGTRTVKNSSTVSSSRTETVNIAIKNAKDEEITADVVEHLNYPDWKVKESSQNYEKKDASTLVFKVKVPAHGRAEVEYTYRAKW